MLGFLDLQAGHAQNRFFNELEDWLSGVTHLIDREKGQDAPMGTGSAATEPHEIKDQLIEMNRELRTSNRMVAKLLEERVSDEPFSKKRSVATMGM